ncbi:DUF937 domain-containing protein [Deinococcus alpinitundrae]|uniref:DUF937 domain-containing protein n=1 Tax=Deinococcus alpinitundrae TaxID=468913 RepID=UPI00137A122F|nr:DUF937 domain-containing protein [Deinococcus alpinitundrae]
MELLDFLNTQFSGPLAQRLGAQVGLAPEAARQALNALWPLQLDALTTHAQDPAGAQQVLDLAASVPGGPVGPLVERPGSLDDLERLGRSSAPLLLGGNEALITGQVAAATDAPESGVARLGQLSLPLLLKLLLEYARSNSLGAAGLGALLLSLRPHLATWLPAALAPLLGTFAVPSVPIRPATPPRDDERRRRGAGWLWAIPLALLLLAGGCYLATQNRNSTAQGTATGEAAGALRVTEPAAGVALPAAPFTMRGQGKAGDQVVIKDTGNQISGAEVGPDGTWSAQIAAPSSGQHTYEAQNTAGDVAQLQVTVGDGAADTESGTTGDTGSGSAANGTATTPGTDTGSIAADTSNAASDSATTDTGTTGTSAAASSASAPTINAPLGNVTGAFDLTGSGVAGQSVTVYEDGADIGTATVDTGGQWTLNVPSPAAGAHQYEVRGEGGQASTRVTVGAASGGAVACDQDFTLSLQDGQNVTSPFRFGGQGSGSGYNVSVKRGERTVGTKRLPLSTACGWSYASNPGKGEITYVVRPGTDRAATPISTITLNVK